LSFPDSPFARESMVTWMELIKVPVAPFRRSPVTHQRKSGRNLRPLLVALLPRARGGQISKSRRDV
jgi:hypothetical protein